MGAIQTCASTQQQCDFWMTFVKKIKMEKIIPKNIKGALRKRNANKTTVLQLSFYCRIVLRALHMALICNSTTSSFEQMHFKHEQPLVLSPNSHIQSVRFSKHRTQPTCFEYIDIIVDIPLDQRSYWDSSQLVERPRHYQHGIWLGRRCPT